jgi:hypothetical protein
MVHLLFSRRSYLNLPKGKKRRKRRRNGDGNGKKCRIAETRRRRDSALDCPE